MDSEAFTAQVVQNIRKARWAAKLTQEQVAERGISYKHYQEIEGGRREPTLATLHRLAEIFGTTVSELTAQRPFVRDPDQPFLAELDVEPPKRGRKKKG